MKRPLLLAILSLFIANAAVADQIGIYADATGSSCNLTGTGLTETVAVIHKSTSGAAGSRFRIDHSAATGINVVGMIFPSPSVPIGNIETDMLVDYGGCRNGSILVGSLQIIWSPGASGTLSVVNPQPFRTVVSIHCDFGEYAATGGQASINGASDPCGGPLAVEPSTWGSVKALYR
ncbi:MAG TPA: hypothetical protein VJS69_10855 [Candidatus Krumholzibacteria bacterium]|nr:hypothetical protein [Candidatus Krumholzibacteria bacterium]